MFYSLQDLFYLITKVKFDVIELPDSLYFKNFSWMLAS